MTLDFGRRTFLSSAACMAAAGALAGCATSPASGLFFDRRKLDIGIQLYTLGDAPQKDLEGTLQTLAGIGFRDIELPGLLGRKPADIRHAADQAGVAVSSVHVPVKGEFSLSSEVSALVSAMRALGAGYLVVPMFPLPEGFRPEKGEDLAAAFSRAVRDAGETMWTSLAGTLNERAALLKPHGISVGYHNHSIEFMPLGDRTGWEILADGTDPDLVHFEVDVGWLVSAGLDPSAFFERYSGRVRQLHVKDVRPGLVANTEMRTDPTEVGAGSVDWARVLPAAYEAGARHFYYEQEPPFSMERMDSAAASFAFLSQLRA